MNKQFLRFILPVIKIYLIGSTLNPAVAAPSPLDGNGTHFCGVTDCQPDNRRYARTFAANLDVGEPRTVRLIYFLPNDRPYRAETVQRLEDEILKVQTFYAEQMEFHGYGNRTFRVETDAQGEPIVHRVDGQHPNSHYLDDTIRTVPDEIERIFSLDANIYFIVIDNGGAGIIDGDLGFIVEGIGIQSGKNGGYALVADTFGGLEWVLTAHELGHAFGLQHDFRSRAYIMSYGHLNQSQLSPCHAEFLSVHPYFNPEIPIEVREPPTIELISPRTYPADSESVSVQLNVSDSEGLHQVLLWAGSVWGCRGLAGEEYTIVGFDYDGQWGTDPDFGSTITRLSDRDEHPIVVLAVDTDGNVTEASFVLEVEDRSEQLRLPTLVKISGVNQQGPTNAPLAQPFVVEARDQYGNLLPNVLVTFAVIAGEGRLSGGFSVEQTMTDAKGRTRCTLTLGPNLGTNIILVRAPRLQGCEPVHFNARGVGVPPVSIMEGDYRTWHLPDDAIRRFGKGSFGNSDRGVAFSPDSQRLAVASGIGVWLYDVATSRELALLPTPRQVYSVSFSPDGTMLASGSDDGSVKLWDVATNKNIASLKHRNWVYSVSFSPNGKTLASGSKDGTVRLWNVTTKENIATFFGHVNDVTSVSFSPDGTTLASMSADETVKLWDLATEDVTTLYGHTNVGTSVVFAPNGTTVAAGTKDETVRLWDVETGRNIDSFGLHRGGVEFVSFSPDGTTLASIGGASIKLWNVATGKEITTLFNGRPSNCMSFSPDGTTLAVGDAWGLLLWERTGTYIATPLGNPPWVHSVVFSPDGATLASGSSDGTIQLWAASTLTHIATVKGHTSWVNSVAFSLDGRILASGSSDFTVKLWDASTLTHITTLKEHASWVKSVAFSPDGTLLASGSYDRTVRLWNVATKANIATFEGHAGQVGSMYFSPDGATLVSGSKDGTALFWDISPYITPNTPPEFLAWDVNGDGDVSILDLILVARNFGQSNPQVDVNSDGTIDIFDLVLVAQHLGESTNPAAPTVGANLRGLPSPIKVNKPLRLDINSEMVQGWINLAHAADDGSLAFRQGIPNLKRLLAMLIPDKTSLLPNYPNPFNPETWIPYHLANDADVMLTIYNTSGVTVRELDLGHQDAGFYTHRSHAAYWDGRNERGESVASGIYFYQLRAGDFTALRQMTLVK